MLYPKLDWKRAVNNIYILFEFESFEKVHCTKSRESTVILLDQNVKKKKKTFS